MPIAESEPPRLSEQRYRYQVNWSEPYQQKYEPFGSPPGRHARLPEESKRPITPPPEEPRKPIDIFDNTRTFLARPNEEDDTPRPKIKSLKAERHYKEREPPRGLHPFSGDFEWPGETALPVKVSGYTLADIARDFIQQHLTMIDRLDSGSNYAKNMQRTLDSLIQEHRQYFIASIESGSFIADTENITAEVIRSHLDSLSRVRFRDRYQQYAGRNREAVAACICIFLSHQEKLRSNKPRQ